MANMLSYIAVSVQSCWEALSHACAGVSAIHTQEQSITGSSLGCGRVPRFVTWITQVLLPAGIVAHKRLGKRTNEASNQWPHVKKGLLFIICSSQWDPKENSPHNASFPFISHYLNTPFLWNIESFVGLLYLPWVFDRWPVSFCLPCGMDFSLDCMNWVGSIELAGKCSSGMVVYSPASPLDQIATCADINPPNGI